MSNSESSYLSVSSGLDCQSQFTSRPMRRAEASNYLFANHGIQRAPATLAKLATVGGGPTFRHAGRFPLYTPDALDAWAASIMSGEKRFTSDMGTSNV